MWKRKLENRTIEVILLDSDKHLWEKFEIVRVKPIFARNVLLPKNLAVLATKEMVNKYQQKMETAKKDREKRLAWYQGLLTDIEKDSGIVITGKVNKEANLYAKIDAWNIAEAVNSKYNSDLQSHFFKLKKKIVTIWEYTIPFVYKDLSWEVLLKVVAENPEDIKNETKPKIVKKGEEKSEDKKEGSKQEESSDKKG